MKTLFLGRHAKSSWNDSELSRLRTPPQRSRRARCSRDGAATSRKAPHSGRHPMQRRRPGPYHRRHFGQGMGIRGRPPARTETLRGFVLSNARLHPRTGRRGDVRARHRHNPTITWLANLLGNLSIGNVPTCGIVALKIPCEQLVGGGGGTGGTHRVRFPEKSGSLSRQANHRRLTRPGQQSECRGSRRTSGGNATRTCNLAVRVCRQLSGTIPFRIDPAPAISSAYCENFFYFK